jgi:hypothetical protein
MPENLLDHLTTPTALPVLSDRVEFYAVFRIRIGSGFNRVSGSGFGIWIRTHDQNFSLFKSTFLLFDFVDNTDDISNRGFSGFPASDSRKQGFGSGFTQVIGSGFHIRNPGSGSGRAKMTHYVEISCFEVRDVPY